MDFFLLQALNGFSFAAVLFLMSSGMSLIFGVMKVVNIAHGSFYMLGGYLVLSVYRWSHNFLLAVVAVAIIAGVIGVVFERSLLRKYYGQELAQILITVGAALIFKDVMFMIWGGDPYLMTTPTFLEGSFQFGAVAFSKYRAFTILTASVVGFGLWGFIDKTTLGAKLRASVDDNEMAGGVGINVSLVSMSMFALGTALAAFGGATGGPFFGVYINTDFEILPLAFVVVIIGGLGSLKGAAIGSILVGLIDNFGKALFPELSYFTLFAPMALVLAIRPTGLFGRA